MPPVELRFFRFDSVPQHDHLITHRVRLVDDASALTRADTNHDALQWTRERPVQLRRYVPCSFPI